MLRARIAELETELVAERQRSAAANSALCLLSFPSAALAGREYYTPAAARRCIHDVYSSLAALSGVSVGPARTPGLPEHGASGSAERLSDDGGAIASSPHTFGSFDCFW